MNGREFYNCVGGHEELEWLGVRQGACPEEDEVLVVYRGPLANHRGNAQAIRLSSVLKSTWDQLEAALTFRRPMKILTHLARIVGYYSMVANWNASKIAELADRRRGNYALSEETDDA